MRWHINMLLFLVMPILATALKIKPLYYERDQKVIRNVVILPPHSVVSSIEHKNKEQYSRSYSSESYTLFMKTLAEVVKIPDTLNYFLFRPDQETKAKINDFVFTLNQQMIEKKLVEKYIVPDSVLALFDTTYGNFFYCSLIGGFARNSENLAARRFGDEASEYWSLGFLKRHSYEAATLLTTFIIDVANKNISYFYRDIKYNYSPIDMKTVEMMLNGSFLGYFGSLRYQNHSF